jgi:hypothetical protein
MRSPPTARWSRKVVGVVREHPGKCGPALNGLVPQVIDRLDPPGINWSSPAAYAQRRRRASSPSAAAIALRSFAASIPMKAPARRHRPLLIVEGLAGLPTSE